MEKTNQKKALVLSIVGVITLIAVTLGATFAYFTAQGGGTGNINVNANTATTDNLSFQVGEAISLTASQEDFGSGMGNKSGSTFARATLTANNSTNTATRNYYVYLNIESNDFEYTTGDNQAEILLKVTDPNGAEVTSIPGLTRKTSGSGANEVTGFDITTTEDLIKIVDNYEITSTGTETQEWQIEIIFVNLNGDQNANTNKTFNANLIIQEEPMQTRVNLASYITDTLYTEDGVNNLYYHDGQGDYINADQEAEDNSYRFSGANPNNYVCFGTDEETCSEENLYRIIGVFGNQTKLIKYNYVMSNQIGTDGSYSNKYQAEWPTNYYKGNLDISLMGIYYWNNSNGSNSINNWASSELNTTNLNTNYLNYIGSEWKNKIANTVWNIGGNSEENIEEQNVKNAYVNEVLNPIEELTYNAKVGLMYVSDYGYAPSSDNWTTKLNDYGNDYITRNNWMHMGLTEWTITRRSDSTNIAFLINDGGGLDNYYVYNIDIYGSRAIRPTFYLNSDVQIYEGHAGTASDPYRIVI